MIHRAPKPLRKKHRPGAGRVRALLLVFLVSLNALSHGCTPVSAPTSAPEPTGPVFPAIVAAEMSGARTREAMALLTASRDSLAAGASQVALALATEVIRDYPGADGSGEALGIAALALSALGRPGEAADRAAQLVDLLDETHPNRPGMVLLASQSFWEAGEEERVLNALRPLPSTTPDSVLDPARELLREILPTLPTETLQEATEGFPLSNPLRGSLAAEWASALYLQGEGEEAVRWARVALAGPLGDRETEIAQGVLNGRLEEVLGRPLILGAVLPRSGGSPALLQYGEWIYEGIQVALEEFKDRLLRPVQLEVVDDRGSPLGGRTAIRTLEGSGAMGAVGILSQEVLEEAAAAREEVFPLVSPFSYLPPEEAPAVYSLSGPDPGGARMVARAAWDLGLESVAVVRPETQEARVDAMAFQEEFEALGGIVPRDIVYDSGGTFFQPQFAEVESLLPDGLFLPLSPQDIQLLAPQVTFYGLDTLGIQLLGTSGWTEEAVVRDVDSRHTDGVVAVTTRLTQDETEAFQHFREVYESFFQKTLRNQAPAFGYDAASIILTALLSGPRTPEELVLAIEEIQDLPGATGNFSVDRGWVTREPLLVRIQDHELIYITRRYK